MDKNKNQHIRIGKYFRILFTIAILLCAATPAHARLLFSQDYLDEVYRLDTDKIMTVNNIAGLEFESQTTGNVLVDLQNTGDFIFQDAGTPFATFDDSGNVTFENQFDANGNTTLGNALTDTLTIGATVLGGSPLVFEGATADGFETTFGINDPTAARNIAFPDASGTVAVSATSPVTLSATGDIGLDQTANFTWTGIHDYSGATYSGGSPFVFEGGTADAFESTFAFTDPTADNTITFQDASGTVAYLGDVPADGTTDDAIMHWDSATSNWVENTSYLVDETGAVTLGTWNGTDIDISDYTNLVAGTNISLAGDTLNVDDAFLANTGDTGTGDYDFTGAVMTGASPFVFEGGTADTFESTFAFTDPTADNTITFQDASGTVAYTSDIPAGASLWESSAFGTYEDDDDVIVGTSGDETIANAGFVLGGDDLFVAGMAGVEGDVYTDSNLYVAGNIGSATNETNNIYIGDDDKIYFGDDQDGNIEYDSVNDYLRINNKGLSLVNNFLYIRDAGLSTKAQITTGGMDLVSIPLRMDNDTAIYLDTANSKSLLWDSTDTRFEFNDALQVNGSIVAGQDGTDGQLSIYSEQGGTDYSVVFQPNAAMTQNTTYVLPADDGNVSDVLTTNGSGALSWAATGAGDITGVTAGNGLTGGGASGDVTLDVGAGTGITVNANDIAVNQAADFTWTGIHDYSGGTVAGASPFIFEGGTADGFESTFAFTDPTADNTITFQDASGTVAYLGDVPADGTTDDAIMHWDAGTSAWVENTSYLVDETGAVTLGTWNGTDIDISDYTNLVAGTNITLAGDTLNVDDSFLLNTGDTGTGDYDFTGAVMTGASPFVFEGATADGFETTLALTDPTADNTITLQDGTGTLAFTSDIPAAQNLFETFSTPAGTAPVADTATDTLTFAAGSANITITGSSVTDTVTLDVADSYLYNTGDTATGTYDFTGAEVAGASPFIFEGATSDGFESTFAFTDPTADNTITFQNASGTVAYLGDVPADGTTDDAIMHWDAGTSAWVENTSYLVDETGAVTLGTWNGTDIDISDYTNLVAGTNITLAGDTLNVDDSFLSNTGDIATGDYNFTGAEFQGNTPFVFEGTTIGDGFESRFFFTDPTADNTITFQNASGTVAYLGDIPAGASLWEVGANGTYEDDAATIVGPDVAETLSNAGFTLAGNNDLFVGDKLGVEGSIYTDSAINVDKAEDTAFVTLNDTTNADNVSIYTGTGSPNGALAAQAGSIFMDQSGTTYVNTDGGTTWANLVSGTGANTALSNLAAVAINTSLLSDTTNTDDLGSDTFNWKDLFLGGTVILEGATDNTFETTLTVTDPTADRTVTFQDASGTVAYLGDVPADGTTDDAIMHWDSATSNWVENTSYLVDETGAVTLGTWNGTDIDISDYTNLVAGTNITLAGDTLNVDDSFLLNTGDTATGTYDFTGAEVAGASPFVFEGGTADTFESTFAFTDPTADNTITFQDASGTVAYTSDIPAGASLWESGAFATYEDDDDVVIGTSGGETIANAGFVLGGDDLFVAGMAGVEGNIYTDGALDVAGASTLNSDVDITFTGTEDMLVTSTPGEDNGVTAAQIRLTNQDADAVGSNATQTGLMVSNWPNATVATTEYLVYIANYDADTVTDGIYFDAVGAITDAIDVSDSDIVNALNVGANVIKGTTPTIDTSGTLSINTTNNQAVNFGTGTVTAGGALTSTGTFTANSDANLGDAAADILTANGTWAGGSPFIFEGGTADGFESTFAFTDPTADNTITFQNASGTVAYLGDVPTDGTTDDAIMHWDAGTSAWVENTNYLVDETGVVTTGTWNGTDIDVSDYTNLVAGTNISLAGDTLNVDDAFLANTGDTGTGTYDFSGADFAGASPFIFEGGTVDGFESTFTFTDPTADNTITFQDGSGTVAFTGDPASGYLLDTGDTGTGTYDFTGAEFAGASPLVLEGVTANGFETAIAVTDPTADRTVTVPDASGTVAVSATSPVTLSATGDIGLDQTANFTWTGIHDYSGATYSGGSPFVFEGGTADGFESTFAFTDPTADNTITFQDASGTVAYLGDVPADGTTDDAIMHWDAGTSAWVENTSYLVDETGVVTLGTWNGTDIDVSDYTNLVAGTNISLAGDTLNVDDAFLANTGDTGTGTYDFSGADFAGASPFIFEGGTVDGFESTFTFTDPTADNTITFQDGSGTLAYLTDIPAGASLWESSAFGTYEDDDDVIVGTSGDETIADASFTLSGNDAFFADDVGIEDDLYSDGNIIFPDSVAIGTHGTIAQVERVAFYESGGDAPVYFISNGDDSNLNYRWSDTAQGGIAFWSDGSGSIQYQGGIYGDGADTDATIGFMDENYDWTVESKADSHVALSVSDAEVFRVTSGSDAGIGTTTPGGKLEVEIDDTENVTGILVDMDDVTNNPNALVINNAGTGYSILVDEGAARFDDAVTLGDAADDVLTSTGTWAGASPMVFEGATANGFEMTFGVTDPTADRTATFQDASGTVAYLGDVPADGTTDDAIMHWDAGTSAWVENTSYLVDETGVVTLGTWNGTDIDISDYTNLVAGTNISLAGDTLNVDDSFLLNTGDTATGTYDFTGAEVAGASPFVFEGGTADTFESTFAFTDPTADNTITFQDASGTVAYTSDIPAGASLWEIGANGTYEDDAATIVGPDAAETLTNAGFTLAGNNDLFVGDKLGVEGSIYTDSAINVDKAEDTAFVTLNDTTNVDNVSIYTGTGSPDGALSAQAGSLFMDQSGTTYVNTDGATAWSNLVSGTGANTALSNLAAVAINTSLLSDTTNTDDLGSDTFNWKNLFLGGNAIFEGATDNGFETTLTVTDPTADNTVTFQNASGTVAYLGDVPADGTTDDAIMHWDAGTSAWVENTSYLVDETGAVTLGTWNGTDIDISDYTNLVAGTNISLAGDTLNVDDAFLANTGDTGTGDYDFTGAVMTGASPFVFEGGTADTFESTFAFTDPTADNTITFQDASGTVAYTSDIPAGASLWESSAFGTYEDDDDVIVGTSGDETIANAGFVLGGDDLFVAGMAGVEGNIYTDSALIAGSNTTYAQNSLTQATGTAYNINLGGAAGDDLIVDTNTLVVESDNNRVGIGTTAPNAILQTMQTSAGSHVTALQLTNTATTNNTGAQIDFNLSGDNTYIAAAIGAERLDNEGDGELYFMTREDPGSSNTERMRIDRFGNIGIGVTDPLARMEIQVNNTDNDIGLLLDMDDTTNNPNVLVINNAGTGHSLLVDEGSVRFDDAVKLGSAADDVLTASGTWAGGSPFIFEGATANDYESTFAFTDPTADRTITFQNASGTVAYTSDIPAGASLWEVGANGTYEDDAATIVGPDVAETLSNASFTLAGNNDLFVGDSLGVEGNIYTDGSLIIGSNAQFTTSGVDLIGMPLRMDSNWPIYFDTANAKSLLWDSVDARFEFNDAVQVGGALNVTGATTLDGAVTLGDAAADILTASGTWAGGSPFIFEGATADGFESTFTFTDPTADNTITFQNASGTVAYTSDIPAGASLWEVGANGTYEDDAATIVGPDAAETLSNAGFTLAGNNDLFVGDKFGVEGSIYTDSAINVDKAEDTAFVTLNDTTNVDNVSIYTGTGSPNGALAAQAGSLFMDQTGSTYVNTDGATAWTDLIAGSGANTALSNLVAVAINTTLLSDTTNTDNLGSDTFNWANLFLGGNIIFEGATDNGFETTVTVTDPTADRTITIQDGSGTLAFTGDTSAGYLLDTGDTGTGDYNFTGAVFLGGSPLVFEGATANAAETTFLITDPTADRTITFKDGTGTVAFISDIPTGASLWESGAFATYEDDDDVVVGTSGDETIDNPGFSLTGDDFFVIGMAGVEGNVYTDSSFIAGNGLMLNDSYIRDTNGDILLEPDNDNDDYIRLSTGTEVNTEVVPAMYYKGILGYTNDPGISVDDSGKLVYRDENSASWVTIDSLSGTGMWEDGTNGIYENDKAVIVGDDIAETLNNTGFTLTTDDMFVVDELGVEGSIFTDSTFYVDKAEDTAFITLSDTTNTDTVSIYTGTGTPSGLSAQAGSLFLDQSGSLYVNTDNGSTWANATSSGGWTDDGTVVRLVTATDQVGLGTASPLAGSKFNVAIDDANNNTVTNVAVIDHTTSGVVGNGIGSGLLFRNEDSAGQTENTARISGILTNTTSSSETSAITFRTRNAGTSLAETARFSGGEGLLVGGTSETMANPGFSMSSDDVYVAGLMGIEGNVYTDGSFIAGSSLELNDTYIRDTNDDIFLQPDNDPNNYIRLSTGAAEAGGAETVSAMYYEGILSYTNDPGLSINDAGQLVYRDEDSASWVTLDSLSGTGLWEDGTNGVYEDDEAVIVGSDVAETLSNTGFTLAASDMFIADQLGVEGSIFTDNTFNVDKAEDTAFITLNDVTNIDTVSIYTGTGSPNGALAAQAGSLFMDQAGATYVNTDGGTAWSDLAAVPSTSGWTDGGTDVNLTTSTDNIGIGGASLGKLSVDGDTDEIQFLVQGNATQTSNLAVFENSAGTDLVTISGTGVTALTDGTVGAPILTFAGDSNTGMYRVGSDSIGFSAGGVQTLRVGTSGIVTGFLATTDGTAGVPGHSFTNDPDTGMYRSTTNTLGFAGNGANMFTLAPTSATITQAAATSGSPTAFTLTGGAHTTLAASTEDIGANLNFAATKQFATGALATQREVLIQAPTYGFVGASTITDAATLAISGAPIAGTNATITNPMALWVQGGEAQFDGVLTTAGASALNGAVTLGDAAADILTANGTWAGASPLVFEGATANDFETTFTVTDPTADNTITFKNETGTVAFLSDIGGASGWTDGGAVVYNTTAGDAVVIGAAVDQDAKLAVIGDNSAEKGLRVVGASGQSDELFLIEANGGTDIYRLNAYGSLYHKPTTDVSGLEIDGGNVGSKNLIRLKSYNDIDDTDPGILNIEHEKSSSLTGDVTGAHVDMITTQANSAYNIIGFETVMNPADTTKTIGLRIQDAVTDIQLADTAATVAIGNTGTLTFTDGTNTLAAIKDQGDYGFLNIDPKSDTGDPATCAVGDIYVNSFDGTIKACTATNTWEALDGGGSVTSLDTAYDGGQSITVDASGDLVFNLTSTQDFVVQDAGTPRFTVTDTGLVDMTPGSTSNAIGLDIDIAEASTGAGAFTMLNIDGINGANTSSDYDALKIKIGSVSESSTVHPEGLVITNGPTAGSWDTDVENYIRLVKDGSGALGAPSVSNFILIDGGAATDTGLNLGATDIVGTTADINFTNFDVTGSSGNVVSAGTITSGTNTNVLAATGGSETVFNEQQANIDFRVEGDLQNYMLHVDADLGNAANAGRLGIGTNARSDAFAYVGPSYTMNSSTNNAGTFKIAPNTVTNSFGSTVDEYASLWIAAPTTFTQSGTLTNAATIYVQDAPAAATNNYAMLVDAGDVVFDGNAIIGGSTSRTETLSGAFTLGGDDLFVAGTLGVEGAIYTDATATKYQSLDINGAVTTAVTTGSKIGGLLPVQELDADGDSRLLWSFLVPDDWVSGTDILATLFWSPSNTDTGNVAWDVDYASIPDGDTVTAGDFTDVSTTEAAGGTTDQVQTQTFTVANAGIAADEMVVLSVNRDGASGSDTFTGNAHLSGVRIEYTGKKLQ